MAKGVTQLGYMGFEVKDLAAWENFGTKVLGLAVGERFENGGFSLRMDSYAARFFVSPGEANDVSVFGWQVDNADELAEVCKKLEAAGVEVTQGTSEEAAARCVTALAKFRDPAGNPCEIYWGPKKADTPFKSDVLLSNFVAEEQGLGHCVITANSQKESQEFYEKLLGFRLSDYIRCEIHGYPVDIAFFHANTRHHSVAFGAQQRKRIHHFMVEAATMDDVGLAFDRTLKAGLRIIQTLGRHPNDKMFSFYAKTPSGFEFEFGCGGRQVDDATWKPTEYGQISEWGHHPPQFLAPPPKKRG